MDYGSVLVVPVETLRKMLPEFARAPAMASHLDITDFPEKPTSEQIDWAMKHMKMKEGRGELIVTKCEMKEPGLYTVEAPGLLSAMGV
ncbi:protein vreteno-like isoform X1 [Ostrinia nubilalis]|uniref:protein vreteno-like isoform X1 n=1 Tax=Ostrinia nubilalis TaxID=29057 RepID=UPI003082345C